MNKTRDNGIKITLSTEEKLQLKRISKQIGVCAGTYARMILLKKMKEENS